MDGGLVGLQFVTPLFGASLLREQENVCHASGEKKNDKAY
jgi:hypothetical protein